MKSPRAPLIKARLLVVKLGTGVLSNSNGGLNFQQIRHLADQIQALHRQKRQVVLVSSGAISAGMARLGLENRPTHIADLQACAAVGQNLLMAGYERAFTRRKMTVAQILLTHEDFRNPQRQHHARQALRNLLSRHVVPVINENDAVSYDEIKFGDNDQLASMVHGLVHADACILLSNVDGFLVQEPGESEPKVLSTIARITPGIRLQAGGSGSQRSVGGMRSKVLAATSVLATRRPLVIANGHLPNVLLRLVKGERLGTIFLPSGAR